MKKTNSLILIPENARFFKGFYSFSQETEFMTLDEKIKKDPVNREKYRCEARISSGINKNFSRRRKRSNTNTIVDQNDFSNNNLGNIEEDNSGSKDYIKNMTPYEIILDFDGGNVDYSNKRSTIKKPKTIKYFLPKWEIREHLEHPLLLSLYKSGKIMDVTENQAKREMEVIRQKEEAERIEIQRKREEAERNRMENPHISRDLRRLGSGGVEVSIPDGPASSFATSSYNSDQTSFDISPNENIVNENENIINSLFK
jgi:hypothetical protein